MTFKDWVDRSKQRFREEPAHKAALGSVNALAMGGKRRVGHLIGSSIWDKEWDVLVILDACRHDLMQEVEPEYPSLPPTGHHWSNASCSIDWILRNLAAHPERTAEVGYITGNPFTDHGAADARSADLRREDFAYLAKLYNSHWGPIDGSPVETIPPAVLTDHAISAWRRREELGMDRLIVHYMQPHQPYRSKPEWEEIGRNLKDLVADRTKAGACAWQRCRRGLIDRDELWAAYRDNLRWVLDDVTERLLPNVEGEVVLSADHGNAMGEWGEWGHPPGAIGPAVRKVPWTRVAATDEETVRPGVDVQEPALKAPSQDVGAQLDALGYR